MTGKEGGLLFPGDEGSVLVLPPSPPLRVAAADLWPIDSCRLLFFTAEGEVLVNITGNLPVYAEVNAVIPADMEFLRLGAVDTGQYALCLDHSAAVRFTAAPAAGSGLHFRRIRDLLTQEPVMDSPSHVTAVFRGYHILTWDRRTRYCPETGQPLVWSENEIAKIGPVGVVFPRVSPAVIVAITRDDRLLLAQGVRHRGGMYSLIAGFVESGETAEQAVHREVYEEVGLQIDSLEYLGSQPWPFPDSLMLGYRARWRSGEIAPQLSEIVHADWFSADSLPMLPPPMSIARRIIDRVCSDLV